MSFWGFATILGPILLILAFAFAIMRNRSARRPEDLARTEAATRELYDRVDAEDKRRDGVDGV